MENRLFEERLDQKLARLPNPSSNGKGDRRSVTNHCGRGNLNTQGTGCPDLLLSVGIAQQRVLRTDIDSDRRAASEACQSHISDRTDALKGF